MDPIDFDLTRDTGGVSDLELDRLVAGELDPIEEAAVRRRVEADDAVRARLAERERGFAAFGGEVDGAALFERIAAKVDFEAVDPEVAAAMRSAGASARPTPAPRAATPWWRRLFEPRGLALLAAGVAAVVLLVPVGTERGGVGPGSDTVVRVKSGSVALGVRLSRGGADAVEAYSGDTFRSGDRLRFVIDAPEGGHALVAGREAGGTVYTAWPLDSRDQAREVAAGKAIELDGAVELDGAPGGEWLALVVCEAPFALSAVRFQGDPPEAVAPAEGCGTAMFHVAKGTE